MAVHAGTSGNEISTLTLAVTRLSHLANMTRLWTAASVLFVAAAASSPHPPQMPPADLPPGGRGVYTNEGSFDVGTGESSIM